jgi:RNA polymerase sigma factor (sigma-70 family)
MLTHHKAVDLIRSNERHRGVALTDEVLQRMGSSDNVNVEDEALRCGHHAQVSRAIAQLSDAQRQVIILAYFGGYSQTEIARLTNTALGTVKTRTLHGLRHLRANLELASVATEEGCHRHRRPV